MKKQIYLSRFIIETTSPFAIKSGNAGIILDSLVARDANDLPYIPATSLTGVLRSILPLDLDHWFGIQDKDNDKSKGSQVILSDAYLMDEDGKTVLTGLRGKISPYAKSFKSYDDQYFYGKAYYSYLKNYAHKEELFKRFSIKQMPKFTPSALLLSAYKRFKKVYEMKDKEQESNDIQYHLEVGNANKTFEPQFQKLRDEYKTGSINKRTIKKEYNELIQKYSYATSGKKYSIPLKP